MNAPHLMDWLARLEHDCAQLSITGLDIIIDQAGCDSPLIASVVSTDPTIPYQSLFQGLPEEDSADIGPLLVRIDLTQPMQRQWLITVINHLGHSEVLLILASFWPFALLAEHLGRCLQARNGKVQGLLRYYDPRLFSLLVSQVLQPHQQQLWLRPAVFWSWLDRDQQPAFLWGNGERPEALPQSTTPVELSDSQIEAFSCASDAMLAVTQLEDAFPAAWSAEQRFQACYAALLKATQAGVREIAQREAFTLETLRIACTDSAQKGHGPHA